MTFHTARSTAYPQPAPGEGAGPGPLVVPAEQLRSAIGLTSVRIRDGGATVRRPFTDPTNPNAHRLPMNISQFKKVRILSLALHLLTGTTASAQSTTSTLGDPVRGQSLYQACMGCHSLDDNDVGPKHRGVVGRRAGTIPDYAYSPALKASGLTWDTANLDRWLTNPQALVPGAKMYFSIANPRSRADLIAYLAQQK